MLSIRKIASAALAVLAVAALSTRASAQEAITLDFAGGVGVPAGDLADFQDLGPAFDIGLDVRVHPRFSLRASGGAEIMKGATIDDAFDNNVATDGLADMSAVHFNGGGVFHVLPDGPWRVDFNGGAGVTIFTSERQEVSGVPQTGGGTGTEIVDLSETALNVTAGLDIGYMISEQAEFFVGADGHYFLLDEEGENVSALNNISPTLDAPSSGFTFPVAGGVRFHFQP